MTTTTISSTQIDSPSRSKMAGPCWVAIGGTYASTSGATIEAVVGQTLTVTAKVTLRRATRTDTQRASWTVRVTGDPADVAEVRLGSPQAIAAEIRGAVLLERTD